MCQFAGIIGIENGSQQTRTLAETDTFLDIYAKMDVLGGFFGKFRQTDTICQFYWAKVLASPWIYAKLEA